MVRYPVLLVLLHCLRITDKARFLPRIGHIGCMGKERRILSALLLVAIFGGIAWLLTRSPEPVYGGKPLIAWLQGVQKSAESAMSHGTLENRLIQDQDQLAILQI